MHISYPRILECLSMKILSLTSCRSHEVRTFVIYILKSQVYKARCMISLFINFIYNKSINAPHSVDSTQPHHCLSDNCLPTY